MSRAMRHTLKKNPVEHDILNVRYILYNAMLTVGIVTPNKR
jgi:hypothetical protein